MKHKLTFFAFKTYLQDLPRLYHHFHYCTEKKCLFTTNPLFFLPYSSWRTHNGGLSIIYSTCNKVFMIWLLIGCFAGWGKTATLLIISNHITEWRKKTMPTFLIKEGRAGGKEGLNWVILTREKLWKRESYVFSFLLKPPFLADIQLVIF